MPDARAGAEFIRGLLSTALPYHYDLKEKERQSEERERTGMLSILNSALQSENLDPQAYPVLLEKAMELHGAKSKDIAGVRSTIENLLSQGFDTKGTLIKGYDNSPSTIRVGEGDSQVTEPFNEPAPIAQFGADIKKPLFQSSIQVAQREATAAGAKESAIRTAREPFEISDDERKFKLEQMKTQARDVAARERAKQTENLLVKRHGLKALEGIDSLAANISAANPLLTPEEAREQAGSRLLAKANAERDLLTAKVGLTNATTDAVAKRLFYEGERVSQGWERVKQGWDGLDLRSQTLALEEGYKQALVQMKGNSKKQQEYAAKARPLLDRIRQTESDRASLERMIAGGLAGDKVGEQVKEYADKLITLRDELQTLTNSYTGSLETPKLDVQPTRQRGSKYVAPKVSPVDLQRLIGP